MNEPDDPLVKRELDDAEAEFLAKLGTAPNKQEWRCYYNRPPGWRAAFEESNSSE